MFSLWLKSHNFDKIRFWNSTHNLSKCNNVSGLEKSFKDQCQYHLFVATEPFTEAICCKMAFDRSIKLNGTKQTEKKQVHLAPLAKQ